MGLVFFSHPFLVSYRARIRPYHHSAGLEAILATESLPVHAITITTSVSTGVVAPIEISIPTSDVGVGPTASIPPTTMTPVIKKRQASSS